MEENKNIKKEKGINMYSCTAVACERIKIAATYCLLSSSFRFRLGAPGKGAAAGSPEEEPWEPGRPFSGLPEMRDAPPS